MPWFRFIDELKVTLPFRNGPCELTFANLGEGGNCWAWVAQKQSGKGDRVVLHRAGNMMGLRTSLAVSGFEVPSGSAAERIMLAAVKYGVAEILPDDEHWRDQILTARAKIRRLEAERNALELRLRQQQAMFGQG